MKKRILCLAVAICTMFTTCITANAAVSKTVIRPQDPSTSVTTSFGTPMAGTPISSAPTFKVYLSPSSQFANPYVNGGSEEQYMRMVANAMTPYLDAYGIKYVMAQEKKALPQSVWPTLLQFRADEAAANQCDLYLAIHSNATGSSSKVRYGADIYYYTGKPMSRYWAEITQQNYVYPDKNLIKLATNDRLIDMYAPTMPSLLVETAYHDNVSDANWIKSNINQIAASLAYSIAQYRHDFYGVEIPAVNLAQ